MKSKNPLRMPFKYSYKRVTLYLILINVLVFFLSLNIPKLGIYFPLNTVAVLYYKMYWQFGTYMFMHGSLSHLFFNMLGLLIFGTQDRKSTRLNSSHTS